MPIATYHNQIEFDYLITPDGLEYDWHDANSPLNDGRWLLTFEGQGLPDPQWITQQGPFQHGISVLDYRLPARTITYLHHRSACNRQGYWDARAELIDYCRPNRQVPNTPYKCATLRKVFPNGTVWDIDVVIQSGPYGNPRSLNQWRESRWNETLKWLAPDPTFYNPTQTVLTLDIELCNNLEFPFEFPFEFCGDSLVETDSIDYAGTWLTNPIVRFTGPWNTGAYIRNITTDEILQFNRAIPAGTVITIDTRYGEKTVTDQLNNSWLGNLENSDLATFHLEPRTKQRPTGTNSISAGGTGGVAGLSKIEMSFLTRYIGI